VVRPELVRSRSSGVASLQPQTDRTLDEAFGDLVKDSDSEHASADPGDRRPAAATAPRLGDRRGRLSV
jgi:hypothetical protein